jgi:hypothetical protein
MYDELRKLTDAAPFVPFTITMSSGREVLVRSRDHIMFQRVGFVVVMDDLGLFDILPMTHITGLSSREVEV